MARKQAQAVDWFQDPSLKEIPNPKSPGVFSLAKRQKWLRRVIIADITVAPLILLLILVFIFGGTRKATTVSNLFPASNPGAYQGQIAIQQWLNSQPAPLPGGHIVSLYKIAKVPAATATASSTQPIPDDEIVSYIILARGTFYKVSVEAQVTGSTASIISDPYLAPIAGVSSVPGVAPTVTSPWPGITPAGIPTSGPLQQSVQGWADAFTSGSPSALALSVGDPNSSDHYVPLQGVAQVTTTIEFYAPINKQGTEAIAEVNLAMTWKGEKPTTTSNYTFDILIERPLSAAPVVVAWGPPGSGPQLKPYQNAIS